MNVLYSGIMCYADILKVVVLLRHNFTYENFAQEYGQKNLKMQTK